MPRRIGWIKRPAHCDLLAIFQGMDMFNNEMTNRISDFLTSIGIGIHPATLAAQSFLPGITVRGGALHVDESRLLYPGDLLHEAGHLALMSAEERAQATDEVDHDNPAVVEVGAIAWSYAALTHLGMDAREVFHDAGYRGHAKALLLNFELGIYLGVDVLVRFGLTSSSTDGLQPRYPQMQKWVRE
jgi:hypothetical protein